MFPYVYLYENKLKSKIVTDSQFTNINYSKRKSKLKMNNIILLINNRYFMYFQIEQIFFDRLISFK